ncbi:uncharacterized protein LOC131346110 [Hemibagrus wyckioides]|uniref:uncharacterized protein LOC131346110 n=1 Tax=Hemibagrus wyckioides TaxID=337641 RepID=UPI00266BB2CB|nr:uncharacterized protein LOC131346110 [Hemibagrus wyckioides]
MTTLFVALCVLFSLFTAVNSSDIKELHVRTVKSGEDVTMECNISSVTGKDNVVWFRQSSGKLPQYFARPYQVNSGYKFFGGFNDNRFSISVNDQKFDLNINKIREDDGGEYFCGEMEGPELKFTSGTHLQFEGTTENSTSSDDEGEDHWIIPLAVSNIISVIVITVLVGVLYKNHRKDSSSSNHQIPTNQAAADDVLNYAAVSFAKKPSSSRTFREKSHEDVYAQVKIK